MKKIIYLAMCLLLTSTVVFAQKFNKIETIDDGATSESRSVPCLNETQRAEIKTILHENVNQLKQQGKLQHLNKTAAHPLFIWPVKQADGSIYESIWGRVNQVDHDPASPNMLSDYNCGERTTDNEEAGFNHQGTDIRLWPFSWDMMDNDIAEVVAGDAGQIIGKFDGNDDRNCDNSPNPWNAVYIQHIDGSVAWYGSLKNGSLTSKEIGDTVLQGEFLGIMGSSGVSNRAHVHFEVYDADTNLVDPYAGACNSMNADSWWLDQKPYIDPSINAVLTHRLPFSFGDCADTHDVLNLQNDFYVGDEVFAYVYLRDAYDGTEMQLKIRDPNNIITDEATVVFSENFSGRAVLVLQFVVQPSDLVGTYTLEVTYEGQTVIHSVTNLGVLGVEEASLAQTVVYPNPMQSKLFIDSESNIVAATIRDVVGKSVIELKDATRSLQEIDVSVLTQGIYFITLVSDNNQSEIIKLIKE